MSVAIQPRLFGVEQHELTSDDHYTPEWIFDRMAIGFDLDVCAPPGGVPWIPATHHYSVVDDGLASEWYGRVWMNPPFSRAQPWIDKFVHHRHGVCLVQVSKGSFTRQLWNEADAIWMIDHDIKFSVPAEGIRRDNYMPCWMAAFGEDCVEAISRLGKVRR